MQAKSTADFQVPNVIPKTPEVIYAIDVSAHSGHDIAKVLIEHIARVGALGYFNELVVDGETWVIGITKGVSGADGEGFPQGELLGA